MVQKAVATRTDVHASLKQNSTAMGIRQGKRVWQPVKAPRYDQKKVCSCKIAMGNVPTAVRKWSDACNACVMLRADCCMAAYSTWCISVVASLLKAAEALTCPAPTGASGYSVGGLAQQSSGCLSHDLV